MTPAESALRVKTLARDAGFDLAGIASAGPSATAGAFRRWLASGEHAAMSYLERGVERREDPRRILPGARSVVAVATRYAPAAEEEGGEVASRVARYARGPDYHDGMGDRLERLARAIEGEFPGARTRGYVDTGPVLEREWAARAGLGAIGKNTNLLHPEHGSWLLLGELLTTLDLAPDLPLPDLCGNCTRCLDACPTRAFPEPFRLDSRRCISYWTIEHRGAIPRELRREVGEWVFGCDVCQEVCPWNRRAGPVERESAGFLRGRDRLDLATLLALSPRGFAETFRGSALKRAKRSGLRRNAAVALGRRGDPRDVPALERALGDEDPVVRGHAAWALGEIGGAEALSALARAAEREEHAEVRDEIAAARTSARAPRDGAAPGEV